MQFTTGLPHTASRVCTLVLFIFICRGCDSNTIRQYKEKGWSQGTPSVNWIKLCVALLECHSNVLRIFDNVAVNDYTYYIMFLTLGARAQRVLLCTWCVCQSVYVNTEIMDCKAMHDPPSLREDCHRRLVQMLVVVLSLHWVCCYLQTWISFTGTVGYLLHC